MQKIILATTFLQYFLLNNMAFGFLFFHTKGRSSYHQYLRPTWYNENYSTSYINQLWDEAPKQLLTIGKSGYKQSHINSLRELLHQHKLLVVKFSTDKNIDVNSEVKKMCSTSDLINICEIMHIRWKSFLVKMIK